MHRVVRVSGDDFVGVPLSVCFATGEDIELCRSAGRGVLTLEPPFHLSENDMYLVLPDDIGMEIVDIMRDGDVDLLGESMRDGLLVLGTMERSARARVQLHVEHTATPAESLPRSPISHNMLVTSSPSWGYRSGLRKCRPTMPHIGNPFAQNAVR